MTDKEKTPEEIQTAERLKAAYSKSLLPADHPLSTLGIISNPTDQEKNETKEEKTDPIQKALDARRQEILDAEKAKKQKRQDRLGGPKVVKL